MTLTSWTRVGAIAVPTLVLCVREDRLTPVKYSEYLASKIKGARLVVVDQRVIRSWSSSPNR